MPPSSRADRDTRDLARGAGVNYLGFILRIAPRLLFLVLAGRLYGDARFGEYTFGITLVETAAALALFGFKRSLFKFMSEEQQALGDGTVHRSVAEGIAVALTLGTLVTLAVGFAAGGLARIFRMPAAAGTLLLLTPAVPLIVLSDILLVAIRFTRQMRFEVYSRSIAEPVTLTLALVALYGLGARENGLVLAYVLSLGVAAATSVLFFVQLFPVRRCLRTELRWSRIRSMVSFTGPTAGYELLLMFTDKVDIFLVTYFSTPGVVGIYGMARQLSTVTKKIRQGFDRILPPVLSQSVAAGDMERAGGQVATVARWILSVELLIVLVFAFYGQHLLGLFGESFADGALILVYLMMADALNGSLGLSELPPVYLRPTVNLWVGGAMLAVAVGSILLLIRPMGAEGAALGVAITYGTVNGARVLLNRKLFGMATVKRNLLKPLLAALPAAGLVAALMEATVLPAPLREIAGLPLLIVLYLGALRLLGLEPEDREQLERVRRKLGF